MPTIDKMIKLKQLIKDIAYSPECPGFLSKMYFDLKDSKNRDKLKQLLDEDHDLLDVVEEKDHWKMRIDAVLEAEDNKFIPRHEGAGTFSGGYLIMHNGLKIDPLSYYSFPLLKMLISNKGVHEPQEEKVYHNVLASIGEKKNPTMIELGSYWAFYSMWFKSKFPDSRCFMVEPDKKNLYYGNRNFGINRLKGHFIHAGIGNDFKRSSRSITIDQLCESKNIDFLDMLHADIQGSELEMIRGAHGMLSKMKVGYCFISTHSPELHQGCKEQLLNYGYTQVTNIDLDESCSWDGLIVMKSPGYEGIEEVSVTKKKYIER